MKGRKEGEREGGSKGGGRERESEGELNYEQENNLLKSPLL